MESSQEQSFLNPTNKNSTSLETEDPIIRLSSSSSSSCSSIEAEPKPDENPNKTNNADQFPPTQIMERSGNSSPTATTSSPEPDTPSYRIPSHVFARTPSTAPVEWSTMSNESLFEIQMGNTSFTRGEYFKSGELTFPQPPSPITPSPLPSPPNNTNQGGEDAGGRVVMDEETKTPVAIAKKAAETDKAYRTSKDEEQKAAASIREVIMANEAANKEENKKFNKLDRSVSRRSEDLSVKSFAFPILGNADKGGLIGSAPQKKQRRPSQPETPKIYNEAEGNEAWKKEEAPKSTSPKAEADRPSNRNPKWLSCFPCCATFCV